MAVFVYVDGKLTLMNFTVIYKQADMVSLIGVLGIVVLVLCIIICLILISYTLFDSWLITCEKILFVLFYLFLIVISIFVIALILSNV